MSKLIIIRGNSGSGKTTVARELRERLLENGSLKVALIEQDYFRRTVLKEKDSVSNTDFPELLVQTVTLLLNKKYIIIVEGIFSKKKYEKYLLNLIDLNKDNNYVFYIDVSLEETFRRHVTKPNSDEFGKEEIRRWYLEKDYLKTNEEIIIKENNSQKETVDLILKKVDLSSN